MEKEFWWCQKLRKLPQCAFCVYVLVISHNGAQNLVFILSDLNINVLQNIPRLHLCNTTNRIRRTLKLWNMWYQPFMINFSWNLIKVKMNYRPTWMDYLNSKHSCNPNSGNYKPRMYFAEFFPTNKFAKFLITKVKYWHWAKTRALKVFDANNGNISVMFIMYSVSNTFLYHSLRLIASSHLKWPLDIYYQARIIVFFQDRQNKVRQINKICMPHSLWCAMQPFQLWHSSFPQSNVWGWLKMSKWKKNI